MVFSATKISQLNAIDWGSHHIFPRSCLARKALARPLGPVISPFCTSKLNRAALRNGSVSTFLEAKIPWEKMGKSWKIHEILDFNGENSWGYTMVDLLFWDNLKRRAVFFTIKYRASVLSPSRLTPSHLYGLFQSMNPRDAVKTRLNLISFIPMVIQKKGDYKGNNI